MFLKKILTDIISIKNSTKNPMQFYTFNFILITIVGCIGYYGHQCVHKCNPGYYGFGCREKCNCVPCYNVNGSCCKSNRIYLYNRRKIIVLQIVSPNFYDHLLSYVSNT